MQIDFVPKNEYDRVRKASIPSESKLELLSALFRYTTLNNVKQAGSGHLGTSFSAMDIFTVLYEDTLNFPANDPSHPDRDVFFSSKGHDCPGLYSVLYSKGFIPEPRFLKLRRLGGLHGHPDVSIPGIEANTGSLGMGISKARGMAFAKKYLGRKGHVFVMTGDGEWQEGQNFESLQSTVQQKIPVTVVMDHNKLQSDRLIDRIVSLGDFKKKVESFGWKVLRIDGHSFSEIREALRVGRESVEQPVLIICDTIKGKGVSFMEHPTALAQNKGFYRWHAGAPDDESFVKAQTELRNRIETLAAQAGLGKIQFNPFPTEAKTGAAMTSEVIAEAYGKALVELASDSKNFVVLDADLSLDCKLRAFEDQFPDRFVEMGIAEQDMVSMGSGIARQGLLPVINSFGTFLSARANEQIYNALTEHGRMIFANHYAGLIPAGPGKSHQSVRDISLFCAFPNCQIVQPANSEEARWLTRYAVRDAKESVMIRFNIGPSPRLIPSAPGGQLGFGQGNTLIPGSKALLFSYGPVMLHEAMGASELLSKEGVSLGVINQPWLNRFDLTWLRNTLAQCTHLFVLEDHSTAGGLADRLWRAVTDLGLHKKIALKVFGVDEFPACGTPIQALEHHGLDSKSVARRVQSALKES